MIMKIKLFNCQYVLSKYLEYYTRLEKYTVIFPFGPSGEFYNIKWVLGNKLFFLSPLLFLILGKKSSRMSYTFQ